MEFGSREHLRALREMEAGAASVRRVETCAAHGAVMPCDRCAPERVAPGEVVPDRCRVIEIDTMTGAERTLDNYASKAWSAAFTREQAEESVAWRRAHITGRYDYRIETDTSGGTER